MPVDTVECIRFLLQLHGELCKRKASFGADGPYIMPRDRVYIRTDQLRYDPRPSLFRSLFIIKLIPHDILQRRRSRYLFQRVQMAQSQLSFTSPPRYTTTPDFRAIISSMTPMDRGTCRTYTDAKARVLRAVTKQCGSCGMTVTSATRNADGERLEKCPACHHPFVTEMIEAEAHDNVASMCQLARVRVSARWRGSGHH